MGMSCKSVPKYNAKEKKKHIFLKFVYSTTIKKE